MRKNKYIQTLSMVLIASLGLVLAGCACKPKVVSHSSKTPTQLRQEKIKYLRKHGVQVIKAGQDITLVFRSDRLFNPHSANFNENYQPVLKKATQFIRSYDKVTVKVAAYAKGRKPLTVAQAKTVEEVLSSVGINARLTYAVGEGGKHPVAFRHSALGRSVNRRVEISFRFYPKFSNNE